MAFLALHAAQYLGSANLNMISQPFNVLSEAFQQTGSTGLTGRMDGLGVLRPNYGSGVTTIRQAVACSLGPTVCTKPRQMTCLTSLPKLTILGSALKFYRYPGNSMLGP